MARPATSTAVVPARGQSDTVRGTGDLEAKIRSYLRILVEAPIRASDRLEPAKAAFIDVAAGWAALSGVDRKTLAGVGVPREVLDAAGIAPTPIAELVRRQYGTSPFTVADLVRKSGVSIGSVRNVVAEDEEAGRIGRVESTGRTIRYEVL